MPPVALEHTVIASNGQSYSLSGVASASATNDDSYRGYDHVHWYPHLPPLFYSL